MKQRTQSIKKVAATQKQPLVSVVVTCYNYEEYVREAISSIFAQTYPNIEAIVINDGSTDNSDGVIQSLKKKHEFTYINQSNKGAPGSRNVGAKNAKGAFIIFLDADDILPPDYVVSCVRHQEKTGADIVYCNSQYFGDRQDKTDFPEFDKTHIFYSNYINATALINARLFINHQYDNHLRNLRFDDWDFYLSCINDGAVASLNKDTKLLYRIKQKARSNIAIDKQIDAYKYITAKYKDNKEYRYSIQLTISYMEMLRDSLSENKLYVADVAAVSSRLSESNAQLERIQSSREYRCCVKLMRYLRALRHPVKVMKSRLKRSSFFKN